MEVSAIPVTFKLELKQMKKELQVDTVCSNGLSPHMNGLKCSSCSLGLELNLELSKHYDVEVKIAARQCLVLRHLINLISLRMGIVDISKAGICAEI
jgi:hypothetical protein